MIDHTMLQNYLPGYTRHICPAKVSKTGGRNMGGAIVFLKEKYDQFITRVHENFPVGVILKINKHLFVSQNDIFLISVYIPPENSSFYDDMIYSGIQCIEYLFVEHLDMFSNCEIIVCSKMTFVELSKINLICMLLLFHRLHIHALGIIHSSDDLLGV